MSFVAVGLFILACGWNLYRDYQPTRSKAIREEGHPQYFGSVLAAGYLFVLAASLHQFALPLDGYRHTITTVAALSPRAESTPEGHGSVMVFDFSSVAVDADDFDLAHFKLGRGATPYKDVHSSLPVEPETAGQDDFADALAIAFWSALLAFAAPKALNAPFVLNRAVSLRTGYSALEEIERFAADAAQRGVGVGVSMSNKKFYVGITIETGQDGSAETKWLKIRPLASGIRSDDGTLVFTTAYKSVYNEMAADSSEPRTSSDFCVGLPVDQIVSIQNFDLDLYIRRFATSVDSSDPELREALRTVLSEEDSGPLPANAGAGAQPDPVHQADAGVDDPASSNYYFFDVRHRLLTWTALVGFSAAIIILPWSVRVAGALVLLAVLSNSTLAVMPSGKGERWWDRIWRRGGRRALARFKAAVLPPR